MKANNLIRILFTQNVDRIDQSVTNPPYGNPAPLQNPPIFQTSLYIAITFEPIMQLLNPFFWIYYIGNILSKTK